MSESRRGFHLWLSAVLVALGAGIGPGCLDARPSAEHPSDLTECARCHGNPNRAVPGQPPEQVKKLRAAPPHDLAGNTDSAYPGVGAHQIHLTASATHDAFQCEECHVVPKNVEDVGHADSAAPAELTFASMPGTIAKTGGRSPSYDPATRHCADTYCHRDADEVWTAPRDSQHACGTCHSLPPPKPHPQSDRCYACHPQVVDQDRNIIAPSLHVDGKVEVETVTCHLCHGSENNNAPPKDLAGDTATTALGVGAHQAHLAGGAHSRKVACNECHIVPANVNDPSHFGPPPADLTFSGVARASGRQPTWDRTIARCSDAWCHSPDAPGGQSPEWTSQAGDLPCTGCHSTPPPAPHPQMTRCSLCHVDVVESDNVTIKNRDLHVDGQVEVKVPQGCNGCHGSATSIAPPQDVEGNTATTASGVGAHQSHLNPSGPFRPVECNECHIVPSTWSDAGHADTPRPAELNFSGVAVSFGASPVYDNGSCQKTYCHGDHFPGGNASFGTNTTPKWTVVDGSQVVCGSCHALPPQSNPFHVGITQLSQCNTCHKDIDTNGSFIRPDLHVDGNVTFSLPP